MPALFGAGRAVIGTAPLAAGGTTYGDLGTLLVNIANATSDQDTGEGANTTGTIGVRVRWTVVSAGSNNRAAYEVGATAATRATYIQNTGGASGDLEMGVRTSFSAWTSYTASSVLTANVWLSVILQWTSGGATIITNVDGSENTTNDDANITSETNNIILRPDANTEVARYVHYSDALDSADRASLKTLLDAEA